MNRNYCHSILGFEFRHEDPQHSSPLRSSTFQLCETQLSQCQFYGHRKYVGICEVFSISERTMEYASFTGGEAAIKVYSDFEYVDSQERKPDERLSDVNADLVDHMETSEMISLRKALRSSRVQYHQGEQSNINKKLSNG